MLVSDLHLPAVATAISTAVADEIAAVLGTCHGPGAFVIAGDGFEMLAGPPEVDKILDAHPQFTDAVAGFAAEPEHHVVVLSGNHDGQLAWDGRSVDHLRERLGVDKVALVRRPRGGHRRRGPAGPGGPRKPVGPLQHLRRPMVTGGHPVRPSRRPRPAAPSSRRASHRAPFSRGCNGSTGTPPTSSAPASSTGRWSGSSGWWPSPSWPSCSCGCSRFLPGLRGVLHHHAQRWLLVFGLLVAFMVIVAAVAAVATLLRVNRALRETAVSARSDPATHNAPPRAEAARLVTQGYAGMISGHTHEPELSVVGNGFYANTGSGTASVVGRKSRLRLPQPVRHRSPLLLRRARGRVGARGQALAAGATRSGPRSCSSGWPWLRARSTPRRPPWWLPCPTGRPGPSTMPASGGGSSAAGSGRWRRGSCSPAGVLNVVFALLWPRHVDPAGRPLAARSASTRCPSPSRSSPDWPCRSGPGCARGACGRSGWPRCSSCWSPPSTAWSRAGQPRGRPSRWSSACGCCSSTSTSGSSRRGSADCSSGWPPPAWWSSPPPPASAAPLRARATASHFDLVFLLVVIVVCSSCLVSLPGRESRRTGPPGRRPSSGPGTIIERYGGDTLDYFALRDDKSWFFTGESLVAYSVINGVMLISPDPIGPPEDRAEVWSDVMDFAQSNNWSPSVLAASAVVACRLPGRRAGRPLHR